MFKIDVLVIACAVINRAEFNLLQKLTQTARMYLCVKNCFLIFSLLLANGGKAERWCRSIDSTAQLCTELNSAFRLSDVTELYTQRGLESVEFESGNNRPHLSKQFLCLSESFTKFYLMHLPQNTKRLNVYGNTTLQNSRYLKRLTSLSATCFHSSGLQKFDFKFLLPIVKTLWIYDNNVTGLNMKTLIHQMFKANKFGSLILSEHSIDCKCAKFESDVNTFNKSVAGCDYVECYVCTWLKRNEFNYNRLTDEMLFIKNNRDVCITDTAVIHVSETVGTWTDQPIHPQTKHKTFTETTGANTKPSHDVTKATSPKPEPSSDFDKTFSAETVTTTILYNTTRDQTNSSPTLVATTTETKLTPLLTTTTTFQTEPSHILIQPTTDRTLVDMSTNKYKTTAVSNKTPSAPNNPTQTMVETSTVKAMSTPYSNNVTKAVHNNATTAETTSVPSKTTATTQSSRKRARKKFRSLLFKLLFLNHLRG